MKKWISMILGLAFISGFVFYCEKEFVSPEKNQLLYLGAFHHGCRPNTETETTVAKTVFNKARLREWTQQGDTLSLTIDYESLCCAEFKDSVSIKDNRVELMVLDTLHGCRCICNYVSDFSFKYSGNGPFHICFQRWGYGESGYTTLLDTVLNLSH